MTATDPTADPKTAGHDARAVANWFLDRAEADGRELNQLQLHRIVYLAHGWHLGNTGKPLIRDEVQAWSLGPIIPAIYQEFKQFGGDPIDGRAFEFDFWRRENVDLTADFPPFVRALLEKTWESVGGWTADELIDLTCEPGGPWFETFRTAPSPQPQAIPRDLIRRHFAEQVRVAAMAGN